MADNLLEWIPSTPFIAFMFSILLNILIAVSGVLPSAFMTAANIVIFGFYWGVAVSIAGEAAGAVVSFQLYRKGLLKLASRFKEPKSKQLLKLKNTTGSEAVFLVIILRILPFIPSGAVTLAAAYSKMSLLSFSIASTLGKIPSLLIEAYSVSQFLAFTWEIQLSIILFLFVSVALYYLIKKIRIGK
ncbi:TVP38/TMEM64 family protein [Bacillus sp. S/N-304-OC-R1]|uniref:TVP38/TMEM64 family protein n=1 Tax=Bacillus sp. S/N-304-OC-R1 TaxID=2758034 RepID=UPI001C8D39F5|nr:VTT domain-containing protein [Bacillus sp. S/N-304-OC-R1]MBY0123719.1 TVP38/TMEM64 family protein [Bacillus sp. S/N-304-OC-R1]